MPRRCVIYIPLMLYSHWCIMLLMVNDGIYQSMLNISAWGYALLVSTCRAILGAPERGASDSAGLHAFFVL